MYTHIVIDLDGTLLDGNKGISPLTKQALLSIQKELSMKLILASGRPVPFMEPLAQELEMDQYGGFLISNNGATVYDCYNRKYVFENKLNPDEIIEIVNQVSPFNVIPMLHFDNHLFVESHQSGLVKNGNEEINMIAGELNSGNFSLKKVKKLTDSVNFSAYKVLIAGDSEYIEANQDLIRGNLKDKYTSLITGPLAIEFTKKGVDKAFSLDWLANNQAFSSETIMAFGDGQNDMTLFEFVNYSVAMGNAVDSLKKIANTVTLSNLEEGIGVHLNDFLAYS